MGCVVKAFNKNYRYLPEFNYFEFFYFTYHRLFFGSLIYRGRKLWAFKFFQALKFELKQRELVEPVWIFLVSILNITPELILFPKKLGGTSKYVPLPIIERKQYTFAVKWVIKLVREKFRLLTVSMIATVLIEAIYFEGLAIEKKQAYYSLGLQNSYLLRFFR